MPVYFGKIRSYKDNFLFTDPVFGICSDFPKLLNLENDKNYIFVFSDTFFPEADHVFEKKGDTFQLDDKDNYDLPSNFQKYFSEEIKRIYFFLEPIKEDKNDWIKPSN